MNPKILVTYASQGGATAGVAEAIGQTLVECGAQVDVRPTAEVNNLQSYAAVIVGSAIHGGKWMPEAEAFISQYQADLRQMPTAIFQVCMMLATENESYRRLVPEWLAPIRARIGPVGEASFAGALFPDRYRKLSEKLGLRVFLAVIRRKAGDYRDWGKIRAWAEQIYPALCRQETP